MRIYCGRFKASLVDEVGQDLVEYAPVASVIALGAVAAMVTVADAVGRPFSFIGAALGSISRI